MGWERRDANLSNGPRTPLLGNSLEDERRWDAWPAGKEERMMMKMRKQALWTRSIRGCQEQRTGPIVERERIAEMGKGISQRATKEKENNECAWHNKTL
jgi:hypothetical protein